MCTLQETTAQLQIAQAAEQQPISLQIVVLDDSSSRVAATLTPAKARSTHQHASAPELRSADDTASQEAISAGTKTHFRDYSLPGSACSPNSKPAGRQDSVCATPEARKAAAQILRGLGMTQGLSLGLDFDLEPEWPAGPPPSLASSPLMAPGSSPHTLGLPADLARTLNMGTTFASLNSELVSSAVALDIESPQQPKAPLPTPAGTPAVRGGRPMSESTLSLNANDIATAFALAHEQLRTTPLTQPRHGCTAISPVAFALPQAQGRPSAVDNDKESPVVKTTRQVSSVLAAVAELEAAQGVTGKRAAGKLTRPFSAGMTKPQTPGSANTTPMHKFSTRFIQSPAVTQVPTAQAQGLAAPGLSNVANPLFSPVASSLDPMLTPFYTPASMSSIRTGVETPDSRVADSRANPLTEGTPTGLATPASGLVSGDWRSVTDRLQALRAQLQSAQKKLKATSEVGHPWPCIPLSLCASQSLCIHPHQQDCIFPCWYSLVGTRSMLVLGCELILHEFASPCIQGHAVILSSSVLPLATGIYQNRIRELVYRTSRREVLCLAAHHWQISPQGTSSSLQLPCPPQPDSTAAGQDPPQVPWSPQLWLLRRMWRSSACLRVAGSEASLRSAVRMCSLLPGCSLMTLMMHHRSDLMCPCTAV